MQNRTQDHLCLLTVSPARDLPVLYQPTTPGVEQSNRYHDHAPPWKSPGTSDRCRLPDPGTSGPNGPGLASLGYTVLALTSTMSSDDLLDTDKLFLQVSKGVTYLRKVVGNNGKVVLLGHSGGGPTMAGYQFIAENGVKACQGSEKIVESS